MADTPAPKSSGDKNWLTKKVGPLPVWAYGALAVGVYYWYTHYGPGASKQQPGGGKAAAGKRGGLKTYAPHITERVTYRGGRTPRDKGKAQGAPAAGGLQAGGNPGGNVPSGNPGGQFPGSNPGGNLPTQQPGGRVGQPPDKDKRTGQDKARDRDRGRQQLPPPPPPPGQPVSPDTGQPVYWEWTHAHRGPEISTPVPEPQQAYAPMTTGATYDAASTGATAAAALGG